MQSSVYKDRQFEIDALRSTKPVKTGKSVSDVIWATYRPAIDRAADAEHHFLTSIR